MVVTSGILMVLSLTETQSPTILHSSMDMDTTVWDTGITVITSTLQTTTLELLLETVGTTLCTCINVLVQAIQEVLLQTTA